MLLTIITVLAVLALLATSRLPADAVLLSALTVLMISGILTPTEALAGFANTGIMTIAALYIVAGGLKETGAIEWLTRYVLGYPKTMRRAYARLMFPIGGLSAFLNNTTIVAMFLPAIESWAQRLKVAPSKLLIPLSYAAILGGTCTLIGTSTNLVVDGLLQKHLGIQLSLFELAWVGIPVLLVGGVLVVLLGDRLLPNRQGVFEQLDQIREYAVEVEVETDGPLENKTILTAGLRNLNYGFLTEIERHGHLLTAVSPDTVLQGGDRLSFIGAPECALELRRIQGLQPVSSDVTKLNIANHKRCLVEVVLGADFPALGMTIKESRFRTQYQAAILSISRHGRRLPGKLGDIELRMGDTLLIETNQQFVEQYRLRRDFLLISPLSDSTPRNFAKAPMAMAILLALVLVSTFEVLSILEAGFIAAAAMIATRCLTLAKARSSIDVSVLIVIAASFALGEALTKTGAADKVAHILLPDAATPWGALVTVYLVTMLFTELITNNAAAILMFPIALSISQQINVHFLPFAIAITMAASASFLTPIGYQTNLMVYGPGGYRFRDYFTIGIPLSIAVAITTIMIIPFVWSF